MLELTTAGWQHKQQVIRTKEEIKQIDSRVDEHRANALMIKSELDQLEQVQTKLEDDLQASEIHFTTQIENLNSRLQDCDEALHDNRLVDL